MLIGETLSVALGALRANKLRSFLTMLGIVIGVSAVITVVALGRGAQKSVEDRIAALGTTLLTIQPGQAFGRGVAIAGAILGAIAALFSISGPNPWWSLAVFFLCIYVIHGIFIYGTEEPDASR